MLIRKKGKGMNMTVFGLEVVFEVSTQSAPELIQQYGKHQFRKLVSLQDNQ